MLHVSRREQYIYSLYYGNLIYQLKTMTKYLILFFGDKKSIISIQRYLEPLLFTIRGKISICIYIVFLVFFLGGGGGTVGRDNANLINLKKKKECVIVK